MKGLNRQTSVVETASQTSVTTALPVDLEAHAGGGMENVTPLDLSRASLRVAQSLSKVVQPHETSYIEGLKVGQIYLTGTNNFSESVQVVPVFFEKKELEWSSDNALVAEYTTFNAPEITEVTEAPYRRMLGNGNNLVETSVFHALLFDPETFETKPITIDMSKTDVKIGKQWLTSMHNRRRKTRDGKGEYCPPMFSTVYELKSTLVKDGDHSWYNWNVELDFDLLQTEPKHAEVLYAALQRWQILSKAGG